MYKEERGLVVSSRSDNRERRLGEVERSLPFVDRVEQFLVHDFLFQVQTPIQAHSNQPNTETIDLKKERHELPL